MAEFDAEMYRIFISEEFITMTEEKKIMEKSYYKTLVTVLTQKRKISCYSLIQENVNHKYFILYSPETRE